MKSTYAISPFRLICLLFVTMTVSVDIYAQTESDKAQIYELILGDYLSSDSAFLDRKVCLLDSTGDVEFRHMGPDSLFLKYYGFERSNFEALMELRSRVRDSSAKHERLPASMGESKFIKRINTEKFSRTFRNSAQRHNSIDRCWRKFYRRFRSHGYCRFSRPYFIKPTIALVYFYYLYGPLAGCGHVYLLSYNGQSWEIRARIWQWVS